MNECALDAGIVDETAVKCPCQLVQIHNLEAAVRVKEHIGKQICHGQDGSVLIPAVIDNIAVPVEKPPAVIDESADLDAALQIVTGIAARKIFPGMERLPPGHNDILVTAQNHIILQLDTFLGNDPFPKKNRHFVHKRSGARKCGKTAGAVLAGGCWKPYFRRILTAFILVMPNWKVNLKHKNRRTESDNSGKVFVEVDIWIL